MASSAPVQLSNGRIRLEPVPAVDGSTWQVFRPESPEAVGDISLLQPSGEGTRVQMTLNLAPSSSAANLSVLAEALQLACRWAFSSLKAPAISWLGPTDTTLRTVVQRAGFVMHPLPHRAGWISGGNVADAWYADLTNSDLDQPERPALTVREQQVLTLMAQGRSNAAIAAGLNISENTVKNHVRSILEALQADSRTAAVVIALQTGLVSLGSR